MFYAGHGIQADGENWLIPANAEVETEGDLQFEAISLFTVMEAMEGSGVDLNLMPAGIILFQSIHVLPAGV